MGIPSSSRNGIMCLGYNLEGREISKYPKKKVQIPPKSTPTDHQTPKSHSNVAGARKKPILGGRVPHRARQKGPKVDLQTEPTAQKCKLYVLYQKNMICGVNLEATEAPFGG